MSRREYHDSALRRSGTEFGNVFDVPHEASTMLHGTRNKLARDKFRATILHWAEEFSNGAEYSAHRSKPMTM